MALETTRRTVGRRAIRPKGLFDASVKKRRGNVFARRHIRNRKIAQHCIILCSCEPHGHVCNYNSLFPSNRGIRIVVHDSLLLPTLTWISVVSPSEAASAKLVSMTSDLFHANRTFKDVVRFVCFPNVASRKSLTHNFSQALCSSMVRRHHGHRRN